MKAVHWNLLQIGKKRRRSRYSGNSCHVDAGCIAETGEMGKCHAASRDHPLNLRFPLLYLLGKGKLPASISTLLLE